MDPDNDEWTTCPYNKAHRVTRARIQIHIIKCKKNNPELKVCPYNATHRYPANEIKRHCQDCPQKPVEDIVSKPMPCGIISVPRPLLQREYLPETDPNHECWDD